MHRNGSDSGQTIQYNKLPNWPKIQFTRCFAELFKNIKHERIDNSVWDKLELNHDLILQLIRIDADLIPTLIEKWPSISNSKEIWEFEFSVQRHFFYSLLKVLNFLRICKQFPFSRKNWKFHFKKLKIELFLHQSIAYVELYIWSIGHMTMRWRVWPQTDENGFNSRAIFKPRFMQISRTLRHIKSLSKDFW